MYEYFEYKDSEVEIVKSLKKALEQIGVTNFRVATKRLGENKRDNNIDEIIVRSTAKNINRAEVDENFTIYIFCVNDNDNIAYAKANALAVKVQIALKLVKHKSNYFRSIYNISSSIFEDEGKTQIRSILFSCISYGTSKRVN